MKQLLNYFALGWISIGMRIMFKSADVPGFLALLLRVEAVANDDEVDSVTIEMAIYATKKPKKKLELIK